MKISEIKIGDRVRKNPGDLSDLRRSIKELGLLQPVVIDAGNQLVAGFRRIEACKANGWEHIPTVQVDTLDDAVKLLKAERDENTCRVDFTPGEAVEVGRRIEALQRPAAVEKQIEGGKKGGKKGKRGKKGVRKLRTPNPKRSPYRVKREAAEAVNMGTRTYEKATAVVEAAEKEPEKFGPLLDRMNETGNVNKAYKEVVQAKREETRAAAVAAIPIAEHVRHGDFREVLPDVPDGSVDLILTDPPYDRESLPLFAELAKLAVRVLVDGGSLVTYSGHFMLPEIMAALTVPGLSYRWTLAVLHENMNATRFQNPRVYVAYKPLIWLSKGTPFQTDIIMDVIRSEKPEKQSHEWEQSCVEAEYVIGKLSPQGGMVLDPMAGSGTNLVSAAKLGRRFIGVEIDAVHCKTASSRLSAQMGGTIGSS